MNEEDDVGRPSERPRERHEPAGMVLPAWVPTLIGVVLVIMAALAVYTGLRYRNPPLVGGIVKSRRAPRGLTPSGPPGEPEPGGSLVFPGASADANEPVTGKSRAEMTGGPGGVIAVVRMTARRGMMTNVTPNDAMIYVNGLAIGEARQFNKPDEIYDFPAPGSYTIRIVAPAYKERQFVITAADNATLEIAKLDVKLERQ